MAGRGRERGRLVRASCPSRDATARGRDARLFVKSKATDTHSIDVAVALAGLGLADVATMPSGNSETTSASRGRTCASSPSTRSMTPVFGRTPRGPCSSSATTSRRRWLVVLESIDDAVLINANDPSRWDDESIDAALAGLASIHSVGLGRTEALAARALDCRRADDEQSTIEMAPLWRELAGTRTSGRRHLRHHGCVEYTMSSSRTSRRGPRARIVAANADPQRLQSAQHRASARFGRAASVRVRLGAGDRRRAAAGPRRVSVVRPAADAAPIRSRVGRAISHASGRGRASRCRRWNGRRDSARRSASCWWTDLPSTR